MTPKHFVFNSGPIQLKSETSNGVTRHFVKGHIDSSKLDLVNDIVTRECMKDISGQFKSRNIKLDLDHETLRGNSNLDKKIALTKSPLGKTITEKLDAKGNEVIFELNPNWIKLDEKGNVVKTFAQVLQELKSGFLDAFSIAFIPMKTAFREVKGVSQRLLNGVNMINVGLTGNAINPDATLTSVFTKSRDYVAQLEDKGEEIDLNKLEVKSYDKDGAHAHTDNEPLGVHTHVEIENVIERVESNIHRRIDRLWDALFERTKPVEVQEASPLGQKSKEGGNMTQEQPPANVGNTADAKGEENTQGNAEGETTPAEEKSVELKAIEKLTESIATIKSDVDAMKKENDAVKKFMEKANPKQTITDPADIANAKAAQLKSEAEVNEKSGPQSPLGMI